ncbi:DUF3857 domain-containing protein [Flavobacterium soli]|uniref:DUF3857 domain-containing protein n=1 Tax=Flavobacterium soli TaxID=344881 RepID=UPI000406F77A|nr:DUF3857 domain-containing protein [Flavobacterium soli]
MKFFNSMIWLLITTALYSQDISYSISDIPSEMKENANAVVRLSQIDVKIISRKSMTVTTKTVVTILNENGLEHMDASEYFDKSTKIKSIEATILNESGKEIKKIKRKDFKENSISEGSIITDNRVLYLDYTAIQYPFTLIFESEVETSNTAFIKTWYPIQDHNISVEKSIITINCIPELGFKFKENNFAEYPTIKKEISGNVVSFAASNLKALKNEDYSPSLSTYAPNVMMGLDYFHLEGVDGNAKSWQEMGKWFSDEILSGTRELSEESKTKIKHLVSDEKDPIKKAKIVYNFVQEKTRYISIQEGIGGWKPMNAKDVDRLGYGDCKALTNYTKALLETVGVPSHYVRLYGDRNKKSVVEDFVSMQSNHVILAIPNQENYIWLECTNQITPFGFQGKFTDDRLALMLKPEGGEIVKTHEYTTNENTQISKGNYSIDEKGHLTGSVSIKSKGTQYDNKFMNENKSSDDLNKFYKSYFSHINNLKLKKINFSNDKEAIEFSEEVALDASEYANITGQRLMFAVNAYNPISGIPSRYRTRNNPFEISRGFSDYDEIVIDFPEGFAIEAKPENFEVKDVFGHYKTEYVVVNERQLLYKRTYTANPGYYDKKDYESFRKFREQIAKSDNAKIVLVKN